METKKNTKNLLDDEGLPIPRGALCGKCLPARYFLAIFASFGMASIYILRNNLSVAIIAMMNHTAIAIIKNQTEDLNLYNNTEDCPARKSVNLDPTPEEDGTFIWDPHLQGHALSSYFWGYMISQVPGGRIAELYSSKWVMFTAVTTNVVLTLLLPPLVRLHYAAIIVIRILQGAAGGVSYPCMHVMLANWAPPREKVTIVSIVYAGSSLGTVVSLLSTGLIAEALGWDYAFYIIGGICGLWCFVWGFYIHDSPAEQPYISEKERYYIMRSVHPDSLSSEDLRTMKRKPLPCKEIMKSVPFWACLIGHVCATWGWLLVLTELPHYLSQVPKFDLRHNAFLSAFPFLTQWAFTIILSRILDFLKIKGIISNTMLRKIATSFATIIPSCMVIGLCYVGCNPYASVALMTLAITFSGGMFCGVFSNHIDLAPNFAGTLMGITNTISTLTGIVVPVFVGHVTKYDTSIASWRIVFWVTVGFYAIEWLVFIIFGSGELQEWN